MTDHGELLEGGTLRFVRLLPGPIERVWSWLVDPEKRALWLGGGDAIDQDAKTFALAFDNAALTPHDDQPPEKYQGSAEVSFECEVVKVEPMSCLAIAWPDRAGKSGIVTFALEKAGDQVRLVVTHEGISFREDVIGASGGWHVHLDIMAEKLRGEVPGSFWARHQKLEAEYDQRFHDLLKDYPEHGEFSAD